jgi:hypothetical protein
LIEQDAVAINRSSLRNEGKIHLGMVYAAEESLATASLMLDGALSFRRLVTSCSTGKPMRWRPRPPLPISSRTTQS